MVAVRPGGTGRDVLAERLRRPSGRARVLERLVKDHGWRRGAELGVLRGETMVYLLRSCADLVMIGVDLWRPRPEQDEKRHRGGRSQRGFDLDGFYERLVREMRAYNGRGMLMRMSTVEAAPHFQDGSFDFVFIDADHTLEGVRADIEAWWPKVRGNGWMLGHDWNPRDYPGVVEAVTERFGTPMLFDDKVWAVPKC